MALSDTAVKNAKAREKPYKLSDGAGMYLLVKSAGKYWRLDYRLNGKRQTLALGTYPAVSLKEARRRRDAARQQVADGVSPSVERARAKAAAAQSDAFQTVAEEWLDKHRPKWAPKHTEKVEGRLRNFAYPYLGATPINDISSADLLRVLRRIEARGTHETAHRVRQHVGQVFRYAIASGLADTDITAGLRGALAPVTQKHLASITEPKAIGELLRAIDSYSGYEVTRAALKFAPLVMLRPGELRRLEWSEVDLVAGELRIPKEKMKARRPHVVPLSTQAVEVLRDLHPLTGAGVFVFPGARSKTRPMSDAAVTNALRAMGYTGAQMTAHGFRSMASTRLHEMGWQSDVIERQLAHVDTNSVRAAYNYAEHLPERRKMVQAWADYLGGLRRGADVVALKPSRA